MDKYNIDVSDLTRLPKFAVAAQKPAFSIDGTWTGVAPVQGGGAVKLTFTFRADGNTLRGTVKGVHPVKGYTTTPFRKGRIAGNNFSFTYGDDLYGVGVPITFIYTGLFLGDEVRLSYIYKGGGYGRNNVFVPYYRGNTPQTFIAKRVK